MASGLLLLSTRPILTRLFSPRFLLDAPCRRRRVTAPSRTRVRPPVRTATPSPTPARPVALAAPALTRVRPPVRTATPSPTLDRRRGANDRCAARWRLLRHPSMHRTGTDRARHAGRHVAAVNSVGIDKVSGLSQFSNFGQRQPHFATGGKNFVQSVTRTCFFCVYVIADDA
jgi:hypothetical protein